MCHAVPRIFLRDCSWNGFCMDWRAQTKARSGIFLGSRTDRELGERIWHLKSVCRSVMRKFIHNATQKRNRRNTRLFLHIHTRTPHARPPVESLEFEREFDEVGNQVDPFWVFPRDAILRVEGERKL
eukprot:444649-Amorphochlora_amoeboformis.AAC.1